MVGFIKNLFRKRKTSYLIEVRNGDIYVTANVGEHPDIFKNLTYGLVSGMLTNVIANKAIAALPTDEEFKENVLDLAAEQEEFNIAMQNGLDMADEDSPVVGPMDIFPNINQILAQQDNSDDNAT